MRTNTKLSYLDISKGF